VAALAVARADWRTRRDEDRDVASFPSRAAMARVAELLFAALYPRRLGDYCGDAAADRIVDQRRALPLRLRRRGGARHAGS